MDTIAAVDARGQKVSHCPFGCGLEHLDDYGYCCHLVGFTNDGKEYEPIEATTVSRNGKMVENGNRQVSGFKKAKVGFVNNKKPLQKGDRLVNPEFEQIADGVRHMAKRWVSSRVYRMTADTLPPDLPEDEFNRLTDPNASVKGI